MTILYILLVLNKSDFRDFVNHSLDNLIIRLHSIISRNLSVIFCFELSSDSPLCIAGEVIQQSVPPIQMLLLIAKIQEEARVCVNITRPAISALYMKIILGKSARKRVVFASFN